MATLTEERRDFCFTIVTKYSFTVPLTRPVLIVQALILPWEMEGYLPNVQVGLGKMSLYVECIFFTRSKATSGRATSMAPNPTSSSKTPVPIALLEALRVTSEAEAGRRIESNSQGLEEAGDPSSLLDFVCYLEVGPACGDKHRTRVPKTN